MSGAALRRRRAAAAALAHVEPGMTLGLGTGSTAAAFIALLGERIAAESLRVRGAPTSEATAALAAQHGVPLIAPDETAAIDLAVDGADELDAALSLIKGGGGALLREKIVAAKAARFLVIAAAEKRVARLGAFPLPVEIAPFAAAWTAAAVTEALAGLTTAAPSARLRRDDDGAPVVTDGGHWLLDCACGGILDAAEAARRLAGIPGVLEHGLFIGMAHEALLGHDDRVEVLAPAA